MIKELLEKLLCKHEWYVHHRTEVFGDGFGKDTDLPTSFEDILICKKCGKIKKIKY